MNEKPVRKIPAGVSGKPRLIGTFEEQRAPRSVICSECGKRLRKGDFSLVSLKYGKVQKRVCSQDCADDFDIRFWTAVARKRGR